MIDEFIQIIQVFPGMYMWTIKGFPPFAMTWGLDLAFVFGMFAAFSWGSTYTWLKRRRKDNKGDCKLQHGDPVDDSKARITLCLSV